MLKQTFNTFKSWAETLKYEDGVDYAEPGREVIQLMMDRYCEAKDKNDSNNKNKYIAGIMLRFWHVINKLKEKSPIQGLDYSDYFAWLYEAIEYACKYRAWQNPAKNTNAQQAINQCIETIRVQKYYDLNLQKNRANVNTYSLDAEIDADGKTAMMDTLVDEDAEMQNAYNEDAAAVYYLVQRCINKKKIVEAIILDTIAFNDVQKVTKKVVKGVDADGNPTKYTQRTSEFWPFRCVQILSTLPDNYADYFKKHYQVIEPELEAAITAIRSANNQKLYRYLAKTLDGAKKMYSPA